MQSALPKPSPSISESQTKAALDSGIRDRIRAIGEGRVAGVSSEDVMRSAEARFVP
jgi:hypothetical protein